MNSVFVVKSVNVCEDSRIMTDDRGLGVYLTFEDALKKYREIVKDLKDLYSEAGYKMLDLMESPKESCTQDFYARVETRQGYIYCDYVTIYECRIGEWA